MTEPQIAFITYTKGAVQYVTSPYWESQFLDWLNRDDNSAGYIRKTYPNVGVRCCPIEVQAAAKRKATILSLVGKKVPE